MWGVGNEKMQKFLDFFTLFCMIFS
jgi:hypothetical protein